MSFGGLSDEYTLYEINFDTFESSFSGNGGVSKLDWGVFQIGGKKPLENIAAVKILEVIIPFTWYVTTEFNNTFILTETGQGPVTVTLPVGNYTVTDYLANLGTALTAASLSLYTYTATYNDNTYKISIFNNHTAASTPFTLTFGSAGDLGFTNPRIIIGYSAGANVSTAFSGVVQPNTGNSITGSNVINMTGANYLYVCSNKFGDKVNMYLPLGAAGSSGSCGPEMAKVPVNTDPGGLVVWTDPDPEKWFDVNGTQSLVDLDLYLTLGADPRLLLLNGGAFSVKLGVLLRNMDRTDYSSGPASKRSRKV